ncbi:S49 family peptidase [Propionibacterium australiense]|uniref:S49 family peptidase n=1 Tax=Propionibacterium australiense TaxID=119981 RepID=A0A8B3FP37_9ACTN|nr:S49 family peptidase [Propionibacterium australiense]
MLAWNMACTRRRRLTCRHRVSRDEGAAVSTSEGTDPAPEQDSTRTVPRQTPDSDRPAPTGPAPELPYPPPGPLPVVGQPRPSSFKRGFGAGAGAALGAGAVVCALTLLNILGLVAMLALARPGSANTSADTSTTKTIWGEPGASHTLRAIEVTGTIATSGESTSSLYTSTTYGYDVADIIDGLEADDADGLLLLMNTTGGTIPGSRAIAMAAERYRERTGHPVIAYVTGLSASGGMYAMAGADHIYADQGTLIGSIGVIMGPFAHYSGVTQIDNGILSGGVSAESIEQFYLTQGTAKDFGNPFRDMTEEERATYTNGIAREYDVFVQWVADNRGISTDVIRDELGAYLFDAKTAVDIHLADAVLAREEAFRQAATDAGADPDDTKIVTDTTPSTLSRLLGADSSRVFGHGRPMTSGKATSELCTSATTVFAWSANPIQACGG